jgi:hypothetical protein
MTDVPPRRITVADLHHAIQTLPQEMQDDDGGRTIGLANTIIVHFLGRVWFDAHIRHDVTKPGFLRLDFSSDGRREASVFRVIEFAEDLFNLQHVDGFDDCIKQMKAGGEKIESTCAELDFGRFLYIHDIAFRFVVPTLTKGHDYDFELILPGLVVPADAKCKLETTTVNPTSLRNSFKKARTQLPADRPGIVFIKVPQHWITDLTVAKAIVNIGNEFLKTTDRVVSIKYYVSYLMTVNNHILHRYAIRELSNYDSRFHAGRDWDLFTGYYMPPSWNGMPPKWQRIFFFPNSAQSQPPPRAAEASRS